ncbi:MAG: ABC-2 transporter permease [Eubacteriales bacterium]|nr:ABC-2 transporter permease [Eubacteriales bacterium]MDD3882275.1 ABC-2 transporter permease [Eubacteriales bacterium]MDD4512021.1 ABC-2 transporter permease [Eubacteriales bacterium]
MRAVLRRELQSYFHTPVGYVFLGVFLLVCSFVFLFTNLFAYSGEVLSFLKQISFLSLVLCPLLTMRLMSEERRQKTDQLLLTSPQSVTSIILGKYFSAAAVFALALLLTAPYLVIVAAYGTLFLSETLTGYLGFLLQGMAFLAVDLLVSTLTKSQVSAAVMGIFVNLLLWSCDMVTALTSSAAIAGITKFFSLYAHLDGFLMGQLSLSDSVYFLVFSAGMLFICVRVTDARRFVGE